jgi:NADH:ubiquinone reductase (non-electrogenic)
MARFIGRVVLKGGAAAGIVTAGVLGFDHAENAYWNKHDPWRQRRLDQSGQDGEIASPDRKSDEVHYGWCRDADGCPLLTPMDGGSSGKRQRIVVLGTGWGARYFLDAIDRDRYEVRIVSPRNFFLFTPLLPSTSTGTLSTASICSPIRELISYKADAIWWRCWYIMRGNLPSETRYYPAMAEDVDFDKKIVRCNGQGGMFSMHYDKLVVAIGSTTNTFGTKGVEENCLFMKEIGDGITARAKVFDAFERATLPLQSDVDASAADLDAERRRMIHFVVVGGGPTGVECAAELQDLIAEDLVAGGDDGHVLYKNALRTPPKVTLIQSGDCLLPAYHQNVGKIATTTMEDAGIDVLLNHRVTEVSPQVITVSDKITKEKKQIPYGVAIWATGVGALPLTKRLASAIGPPYQSNVRALTTDGAMRVLGPPDSSDKATGLVDGVYAIGDCSTVSNQSLLKAVDALWQQADPQGSGSLTFEEVAALLKQIQLQFPHTGKFLSKSSKLLTTMTSFDEDGDGQFSKSEFEKMCQHIDTKHRSLPPTAQVAKQQGLYLAASLNAEAKGRGANPIPFDFSSQGQMAYVGKNVSVAGLGEDGSFVMADSHITNLMWRAVYWSMLADWRSMTAVPIGWAYTVIFGRDTSCLYHPGQAKPGLRKP